MDESQHSQENLLHREDFHRMVVGEVKDHAIFTLDREGRVATWNVGAERILGYAEAEIVGQHFSHFFTPENHMRGDPEKELQAAAEQGRVEYQRWHVRRDATRFWSSGVVTPLRDAAMRVSGFARLLRDETERKRVEEERDRFFTLSIDMLCIAGLDGYFKRVNPAFEKILGYTTEELLAKPIVDFLHPRDQAPLLAEYAKLAAGVPTTDFENRWRCQGGSYKWVAWSYFPVVEEGVAYGVGRDVSERKRVEEQLLHDALHDALTGLPNRMLFLDRLKLAIERAKRHKRYLFAVLLLDLDRFKVINDSLGHIVGDKLLVAIARRLEAAVRPSDTVARFGGDEFTILLGDIHDASEAIHIVERFQKELALPFRLGGHEVFTTASIGVALSTRDYHLPEDLLRDADTAMYRAKSGGRVRYEVFEQEMHARATERLHLETDLRRAIKRGEFLVHYQPIVPLESNRVSGFEALVRWQHPKRGLVLPAEFIAVAEETGLIIPLGRWVLAEACHQLSQWQQLPGTTSSLSINVNLSSKQFMQPGLIKQLNEVLHETGVDPRNLKLEITESVMMENTATVTDTLTQLKTLGVELHIDDFGTGYSSLSYLHNFFVGTLKIDRTFISRMDGTESGEIVHTIIMLARNLGIAVVAEGIETKAQLARLKELGCPYGQGYLFSKPVDAEAAGGLISQELPVSAMAGAAK